MDRITMCLVLVGTIACGTGEQVCAPNGVCVPVSPHTRPIGTPPVVTGWVLESRSDLDALPVTPVAVESLTFIYDSRGNTAPGTEYAYCVTPCTSEFDLQWCWAAPYDACAARWRFLVNNGDGAIAGVARPGIIPWWRTHK
jgi:hypothetical protein